MTLEQIEKAELEAFEKEMAELDAMPVIKGYCWMCEHYSCKCEEYGFTDN